MMMCTATNDKLGNPRDFGRLAQFLPSTFQYKNIYEWGHLDFVWSNNAKDLLYKDVVLFINKANSFKISQ